MFRYELKEDIWLSKYLQKKCFNLYLKTPDKVMDMEGGQGKGLDLLSIPKETCFISTKISTSDIHLINFIERQGFHLIDTNVLLKAEKVILDTPYKESKDIHFHFAHPEQEEETAQLAYCSFSQTRFHLDYLVPNDIANELKSAWCRNFFKGERGDFMVLATTKNKVVGFLQLLKKADQLVIDLVAVHPNYRRLGIGKGLIDFAFYKIEGINTALVGTQISNNRSIAFYQKMGFLFHNSKYVFHYHN